MDVLVLVGRILFVLIFAVSSVGHLTKTTAMAGYAGAKGVPAPWLAVFGSGLLLVAGAVMVLLGLWGDLGALLLVLFLIPTAVLMHGYWREKEPMARQMERVHFLKDIGLAGAALLVFVLFAYAGTNLGLTLTGPLFTLH